MKPIRLSALTIFLILLAVILIGFLMHHTWESFTHKREGFHTSDTFAAEGSTDLYDQYSQNKVMVVKLADQLYFDPVTNVLIEKYNNTLFMRRQDGTDLSYNISTTTPSIVNDLSSGSIIFTGMSTITAAGDWSTKTVADAKSYFRDISDTSVIFMDIPSSSSTSTPRDSDLLGTSAAVNVYYSSNTALALTNASYPDLSNNTNPYHKYNRVSAPAGMAVSRAVTTSPPVCRLCVAANGYEVVAIPLFANGVSKNSTFIHVMDLSNNKHIAAFYFSNGGDELNIYKFTNTSIVPNGTSIEAAESSSKNGSDIVFNGDIDELSPPLHVSGQHFYADASYDVSMGLIYIAGKVGNDIYRAYVKIGLNGWILYEIGSGIEPIIHETKKSHYDLSRNEHGLHEHISDPAAEITKTLNLIKTMQSLFGNVDKTSNNNNSKYLLKTEVVPPVCPTCPSCSSANGQPCTTCGGNGGSGTNIGTSGSKRDVGRDAVSGTINLGKDVAKGALDVTKDTIGGTLGIGREIIGGVSGVAKDAIGGTVGIGREIIGGVGDIAKDAIGGTVGIGREIVGGVGGLLRRSEESGYHNSYGGPQYNNNQQRVQPLQSNTPGGLDPYSYYGTLQPRKGETNYIPRTADFSSFGR